MIHVVYDDVVTAFCIHRGGRENVKNGGGACFKLTEIRLFLAKDPMNGRCHIENALRQTHTLAGFLVQNLIEQLEHKIIGILRLQYLQFT